ncbi:hypothetical protein KSX_37650 [Ktedonospora formicarum]|uniref:Uncharacterized protein n=1 Tax=Ktedonospora formicarum TaxID=2778364 RepID=A0A8J3HWX1_9CHLR|nr:hypothetical protein KSX_37650 [Ktedonospora formicarum]
MCDQCRNNAHTGCSNSQMSATQTPVVDDKGTVYKIEAVTTIKCCDGSVTISEVHSTI